MAREATEMGILESLRGSGKRTFPNHGQTKEVTPTLGLLTKVRLTKCRGRFPDKFGRDHELMWTTVQDINTGQEHQALFNLKFWPDPHYLELALDCHVAVEPDSNFLRGKGWDRQPEELKELVIQRLQDPSLAPKDSKPLIFDNPPQTTNEVESNAVPDNAVDHVEIDNGTMHPCIPAMNQIVAAVGREAKTSGLVAAGYVFVAPEVFFES